MAPATGGSTFRVGRDGSTASGRPQREGSSESAVAICGLTRAGSRGVAPDNEEIGCAVAHAHVVARELEADGGEDVAARRESAAAAEAMGVTSERLVELGIVDQTIAEPLGGAHRDVAATAAEMALGTLVRVRAISDVRTPLSRRSASWRHLERLRELSIS